MHNLDDLIQKVKDENLLLDSLKRFINGLEQKIADALVGEAVPPAAQAKIDAIFASCEANATKISEAMVYTPPTP